MEKWRIVKSREISGEIAHGGLFATPADSPLHDGTPYRGLHVRPLGFGICPSFKGHSLSPCQTFELRNVCIAVRRPPASAARSLRAGSPEDLSVPEEEPVERRRCVPRLRTKGGGECSRWGVGATRRG
jgi:hypothetical protein